MKKLILLVGLTLIVSKPACLAEGGQATSSDNYVSALPTKMRFATSRMPIKVYIEDGSKVPGFRPDFVSLIKESFALWEAALPQKLKFEFVTTPDAAIVCRFTNDRSQMQSPTEDGQTIVVPDSSGITSATITFLTVGPAKMPVVTENYLKRIALHEIGHAIGIGGHSPNSDDIMYAAIYPEDKPATLTGRDKATVAALYADGAVSSVPSQIPLPAGTSPAMMSLRANNEAAMAMNQGNFDLAVSKLEEAYKLDPANSLVRKNLAGIYANFGTIAMMQRNMPKAEEMYKKASTVLDGDASNKPLYVQVLRFYAQTLMINKKIKESEAVQAKLKTLTP